MQEGILLALTGFWAAAVSASNVTAKPNILYIMADDMSASIVGVYGQPIGQLNVTPHIDSLAKQGVRMTNLFATNSLCAPSRASIQTGTYCHVHGVCEIIGRSRITKNEIPNFAHVVRSVGYETALVGKYHGWSRLGYGYDEFITFNMKDGFKYDKPKFLK